MRQSHVPWTPPDHTLQETRLRFVPDGVCERAPHLLRQRTAYCAKGPPVAPEDRVLRSVPQGFFLGSKRRVEVAILSDVPANDALPRTGRPLRGRLRQARCTIRYRADRCCRPAASFNRQAPPSS